MRTRLLANPAALADYEILEMLLFLCVPRRDTKPQAKGLIQRFGSLSATLEAQPPMLAQAALPTAAADVFDLIVQAAAHISRMEPPERPRLGDWAALEAHLDLPLRARRPPGVLALLLDSRNHLLGECAWGHDRDWTAVQRDLLRQALAKHAAAVIMVRSVGDGAPALAGPDRDRHAALQEAAGALSILLHDWLVIGGGDWVSLRRAGGR